MMEPISKPHSANLSPDLLPALDRLRQDQLTAYDWQAERLNYVPLRGSLFANSDADFDLDEEIDKFLSHKDKKIMLVMGDSGSGKSLYTQRLVVKMFQNLSATTPIPLWISLPSLQDPINSAIKETLTRYGFNEESNRRLT